jgi:Flp pilus assembly protein CpaB
VRYIAISVLFVGLGLAGFAAMQAQAMITRIQAENTVIQEVPTVRVATFAQDLPRGHLITEADLVVVEYTASSVPPSAVQELPSGQWLARDVASGQPVLARDVSVEPVDRSAQYIRVRRGAETSWACVAFCPDEPS